MSRIKLPDDYMMMGYKDGEMYGAGEAVLTGLLLMSLACGMCCRSRRNRGTPAAGQEPTLHSGYTPTPTPGGGIDFTDDLNAIRDNQRIVDDLIQSGDHQMAAVASKSLVRSIDGLRSGFAGPATPIAPPLDDNASWAGY